MNRNCINVKSTLYCSSFYFMNTYLFDWRYIGYNYKQGITLIKYEI